VASRARQTEVVQVPSGPLAPLGAAAFLAVLAYPDRCDYPKRTRFVDAAKMWLVHRAVAAGYSRKLVMAKSRYDEREIHRGFDPALKRIEARRLPAAAMSADILKLGLMKLAFERQPVMLDGKLTEWIERRLAFKVPSVNKLIELNLSDNTDHAFERVWCESKPVLHLSTAFLLYEPHLYQDSSSPRGLRRIWIDPLKLISRPDWLSPVLERAESFRLRFLPLVIHEYKPEAAIQVLPQNR